MRFFEVVISGAALIAAALAVEFNELPTSIEPGKTYTLTYSPKDDTPTTLKLRQGEPGNLDTLETITTTATGGSYQWTVPNTLPNGEDYALEIVQGDGEPNYSGLIPLTGSSVSSSASSSASATSSSSASKSSSGSASASASASASDSASKTSSSSASNSTASGSTLTTAASTGSSSGSPSGSPTPSGSNSTLSSTNRTPSATSGSTAPTQSTNAGNMLASSPIALILGAVAAMAYLN
ncbi:hypothetical protein P280DRAFT_533915 [Massarina eburnea CBS 473.64]|uniref:Yeast cell wall synthesis Kre9/Knh1-like N-terminal domain-containing protein n=1 Tax=Massarina eburnea CBS 473.64 TaxID=1395130 RepID=A0A6A6RLZ8_9PLEO|nr:hypothetical protein P280DRAFT_533915 [Massarina eburnea CBS 473.64]